MSQPACLVVPIGEEHIEGFRAAVDSVARELKYLAFLDAPPLAEARKFVLQGIAEGVVQLVVLDAERVIGWCDVLPKPRPAMRHSGVLGMGVIESYRGRGVGRALMDATLRAAWKTGLTRVELTVRVDNPRARRLYESFGFVVEGVSRNHMLIRGEYADSYLMALLRA